MSTTDDGFQRFTFSLHAGDAAVDDLELRLSALTERIDNIVDKVVIAKTPEGMPPDMPILEYVLRLNPTRDESELIGKAILRIAPLVEERDRLSRQVAMVKMVREDPKTVAALFGEFASDELSPDMFT